MKNELNWQKPWVMKNGRTVELGIAQRRERILMVLPREYKLRIVGREADLRRKTGVTVRSTPEGNFDEKLLVCLTGLKDQHMYFSIHS
jgi:hypothetical protein